MPRFELIATSTFGLEAVVARELERMGYANLRVCDGRVHFRGDEQDIARCNLWLRTADRVLIKAGEFPAADFDQLFDQTRAIEWSELLPVDARFPVSGRSVQSRLHSVPAIQACTKKAIVESLKRRHNRFRFEESGAMFEVEVSLLRDAAMLTIDTTGDSLHKRGYRTQAGPAPLRETLAAGLLQLSYWNRERPFVDPFCGSGTLPIEAAMIGRNMAPGANRAFRCEDWPWMDRKIWKDLRTAARESRLPRLKDPLLGFDHEPAAIRLAERGAADAGVGGDVVFKRQEVSAFQSSQEFGVIVTNPPYGERLGDPREVEAVYRELGRVTAPLSSWSIYVITSNQWFEKHFGRRALRRRKLFNGNLECQYYQYPGPPPRNPESRLPGDAIDPAVPEQPSPRVSSDSCQLVVTEDSQSATDGPIPADGH